MGNTATNVGSTSLWIKQQGFTSGHVYAQIHRKVFLSFSSLLVTHKPTQTPDTQHPDSLRFPSWLPLVSRWRSVYFLLSEHHINTEMFPLVSQDSTLRKCNFPSPPGMKPCLAGCFPSSSSSSSPQQRLTQRPEVGEICREKKRQL